MSIAQVGPQQTQHAQFIASLLEGRRQFDEQLKAVAYENFMQRVQEQYRARKAAQAEKKARKKQIGITAATAVGAALTGGLLAPALAPAAAAGASSAAGAGAAGTAAGSTLAATTGGAAAGFGGAGLAGLNAGLGTLGGLGLTAPAAASSFSIPAALSGLLTQNPFAYSMYQNGY